MFIVKGNTRHRYIGFTIKPVNKKIHIGRSEMIKEIRRQCSRLFKKDCKALGVRLIRFNGSYGVLKCNHVEKDHAIDLLKSISRVAYHEVEISTVATSGTIRALVKKNRVN